ncbi:MAG: hypothetical protein AUJ96_18770 [Armatimonadetes bacterium CG2_30_66_41]|nr:hypothetical protein [Armatimonadota bacterium]OIP00150.1 MAG: hypothetical protein AUJ96_18770 [Armatimonadetes bacterium CG2_30_66_41]
MNDLRLTVRDTAGLRKLRPVTGGVPLAEGAAPDSTVFALRDEEGKPVPLQTRCGRAGRTAARGGCCWTSRRIRQPTARNATRWYVFSVVQAAASGWRGRLVQRERLRNR